MNLVPPDLREIAVLAEPLTIAEKALAQIFWMMQQRRHGSTRKRRARSSGKGLSALVLGVGPVGLLGAMVLATAGFTTYVYSHELPPSPRIDLVQAIGGTTSPRRPRRSANWRRRSATSTWSTKPSGIRTSLSKRSRCSAPTASSCLPASPAWRPLTGRPGST